MVLTTFHTLGAKVVRADEALSVALANRKQVFVLTVSFFFNCRRPLAHCIMPRSFWTSL